MDLYRLGISEARELFRKGEASPGELLESVLERIEALDPKIRAYVTVTGDLARRRAPEPGEG
ncbi:MAG: Asp-tRNA(Asn)/Glu-tRNA(Gln) amidotransferase GatCAB subunit A, partial [Nitrospirota bacterium]